MLMGSLGAELGTSARAHTFLGFLFLLLFIFLSLLNFLLFLIPNLKTLQPQFSSISKVSQQVRAVLGNQVVKLFLFDALVVNNLNIQILIFHRLLPTSLFSMTSLNSRLQNFILPCLVARYRASSTLFSHLALIPILILDESEKDLCVREAQPLHLIHFLQLLIV